MTFIFDLLFCHDTIPYFSTDQGDFQLFLSTTNLTEADVLNPCLVLNQHNAGLNSCVLSVLCKLYRAMACSSQKHITKVDSVSRRSTSYQMLASSCHGKCPPSGLKAFSVCTNMSKHVFSSFGKQKHVDSNCSIIIFSHSPYTKKSFPLYSVTIWMRYKENKRGKKMLLTVEKFESKYHGNAWKQTNENRPISGC